MLAYYAHSEGSGHSHFATLFSRVYSDELKVYTSCPHYFPPHVNLVKLPTEDPDGTGIPVGELPTPDYLHYSPVNQDSIKERSLKILTSLIRGNCRLLIIDVSVEIAALARASSIPYAYVRLPGNRNDPGHVQAFQGAVFLLAYYPREFEAEDTPKWIWDKTIYLGFQSRLNFKPPEKTGSQVQNVLVMTGKGSSENVQKALKVCSKRFRDSRVEAIGEFDEILKDFFPQVHFKGFVENVRTRLEQADLVIGSCGLNATGEILASGKAFVCIPEKRPFQEQEITFENLRKRKAVICLEDLERLSDKDILEQGDRSDLVKQDSIPKLKSWLEFYQYDPLKLNRNIHEFENIEANYEKL